MNTNLAKRNQHLSLLVPFAITFTTLGLGATTAQAITFNFNPAPETPQQAIEGFVTAGNVWSALFRDPVTINVDVSFGPFQQNDLGNTVSEFYVSSYETFRSALARDITSSDDAKAVSSLSQRPAFDLFVNYTSDNPHGHGSAAPYVDRDGSANNSTIAMTRANAKALGLLPAKDSTKDGTIAFNNLFAWDFDRNDGISPHAYDFIGAAVHELGHVLGFLSGVDILDYNSPLMWHGQPYFFESNQFATAMPMDLFRFSAESVAAGPSTIDWTASATDKYFSIDGGHTKIASFATGVNHGDGYQAGHWKDGLDLGIMAPTSTPGRKLQISNNDIRALDVIGWDIRPPAVPTSLPAQAKVKKSSSVKLAKRVKPTQPIATQATALRPTTSVPEPNSVGGLFGIGLVGLGFFLKRRSQRWNG